MKKNKRTNTITIRVDDNLISCLNRLSDKYKCSDSDIIHACVLSFNDYEVMSKKENCKYIFELLKDMRSCKYDI